MSFTNRIETTFSKVYTVSGRETAVVAVYASNDTTSDSEVNFDLALDALSTDVQFDAEFDYAKIESCVLYSDVDATICTNDASTGSPSDTIALKGGYPWAYEAAGSIPNPFTADVTAGLYISCTEAAAVQIYITLTETPA